MAIHNTAEEQVKFLRYIGESTRLSILNHIIDGGKCVTDTTNVIGRDQSLVSRHLKHLKNCNILTAHQKAQKAYYSLAYHRPAEIII